MYELRDQDGNIIASGEEIVFTDTGLKLGGVTFAGINYDNVVLEKDGQPYSRIAYLSDQYGIIIDQFSQLLDFFEIIMPVEEETAMGIVFTQTEADNTKTPKAVLLQSLFSKLKTFMSNDDIYKVDKFRKEN